MCTVHSRLQVFVCGGYDLCRPVDHCFDSYVRTPVTLKMRSNRKRICRLVQLCEVYIRCKFIDRRLNGEYIFCGDLKTSKVGQTGK